MKAAGGVPTQEPHDLDISDVHGVEDDAGANKERMREQPKGQTFNIGNVV